MSAATNITKPNGDIDYAALGAAITSYENKLKGYEEHLEINGKKIADALVEHHAWAAYYDQIKVELSTLVSLFDIELDKRAEEIHIAIKQQSGYNHPESSMKRLILGNAAYVKLRKLQLEINELKELSASICSQFYQRSFTLKHYIQMVELAAQDIVMTI